MFLCVCVTMGHECGTVLSLISMHVVHTRPSISCTCQLLLVCKAVLLVRIHCDLFLCSEYVMPTYSQMTLKGQYCIVTLVDSIDIHCTCIVSISLYFAWVFSPLILFLKV